MLLTSGGHVTPGDMDTPVYAAEIPPVNWSSAAERHGRHRNPAGVGRLMWTGKARTLS